MTLRLSALLLVVGLAGCQWESRPDGADAVHSASDGYYEGEAAPQTTPLGAGPGEIVEPIETDGAPPPVDLTQPAPTTGTADQTSEVEEALTPGTEQ